MSDRLRIINTVISEDVMTLRQMAHRGGLIGCINSLGESGDGPLHIAAYKRSESLISTLLEAGADPNAKSSLGDTSFHISARIGDEACLRLLYASGKCNLELVNHDGLTAEDMAREDVTDDDVSLLHVYGTWTSSFRFESEKIKMSTNRLRCADLLADWLVHDNACRRQYSIDTMMETNIEYSRSVNFIRGKGHFDDRVFKAELTYAKPIQHIPEHIIDHGKLKSDPGATEIAVRGIFATDLTDRLLRTAVYGISLANKVGKAAALAAPRSDLSDVHE